MGLAVHLRTGVGRLGFKDPHRPDYGHELDVEDAGQHISQKLNLISTFSTSQTLHLSSINVTMVSRHRTEVQLKAEPKQPCPN
jgi:hypothetical protein